jgi:hypothetical protein
MERLEVAKEEEVERKMFVMLIDFLRAFFFGRWQKLWWGKNLYLRHK